MANWTPSLKHLNSNFKEDIPDAYIKGWVEFYKLKFKITTDVLIPRPETELLVDEVLKFANGNAVTVLDVGTGSGNIAISIAKNNKKARIFATEVSPEALRVARKNAKYHRVENRIFFIESDLLSVIPAKALPACRQAGIQLSTSSSELDPPMADDNVDVIVTNLPYIPTARIAVLDPSVKDFEPRVALDGGADGFDLYRKLFEQISHKFFPKSRGVNVVHLRGGLDSHLGIKLIVCEIDYTQGEIAVNEAQKYFPEAKVEVKTDLAKKQRILVVQF